MTEWKTLDLFERETKILSQLDHPQIPNYFDSFNLDIAAATQKHSQEQTELAGQERPEVNLPTLNLPKTSLAEQKTGGRDRHFYIARELVSGDSLSDRISKRWRPTEANIKEIAAQILHILVYLHQLSPPLIHRDIKPANIIRQSDGTVYLVDFGTVQDIYREPFSSPVPARPSFSSPSHQSHYLAKPGETISIVTRSPWRLHIEIPLRPQQEDKHKPIALLDWIVKPNKFLSVGDWLVKQVKSILTPISLQPMPIEHQKIGTYLILSLTALIVLPIVARLILMYSRGHSS